MKKDSLQRRDVVKKIFLSFIVTLPVFNTIFLIMRRLKRESKISKRDLFTDHTLAG